ncbi:potassium channel family protein [bacterium]|nr:potassium channel family protein [bacterium]MBU1435061.1 potassium channel family protein [bacterium]MBU1504166.1 potassium channel family protein [bacterium]
MLKEIYQYKGFFRKKLFNLLSSKYYINHIPGLFLVNKKSQVDLFKELIYHYSIYHNDLDLKKLAAFYFANEDYYYNDLVHLKSLLSIVLRWETDVGIALIEEIKNNRIIDGQMLNWKCNNIDYSLKIWNRLFTGITYSMVADHYYYGELPAESYIDYYLNLDFIPLINMPANSFSQLRNISLNNAQINSSMFIWPEVSNLVFNTLYIQQSVIVNLNIENALYANTIVLHKSTLVDSSLIAPRDKHNNINLEFNKINTIDLLKSILNNKILLFKNLKLTQGTSIKSKELYDYYNWYTHYVNNERGKNKLTRVIEVLSTKYYTSITNLLAFSLLVIVLYGALMHFADANINIFVFKEGTQKDFFVYLYMSMTNFTTLGFGEVVASHWLSYLIVTAEVITGYIMLAFLVAIAARQDMKYS